MSLIVIRLVGVAAGFVAYHYILKYFLKTDALKNAGIIIVTGIVMFIVVFLFSLIIGFLLGIVLMFFAFSSFGGRF